MSLFKVLLHYANGESEEDDEVFTTEQEAEDHGSYLLAVVKVQKLYISPTLAIILTWIAMM